MTDKIVEIEGKKLKLTNLEKKLFPPSFAKATEGKLGYTKLDIINYYSEMAEYILPYLKDRPINLHRFPDGIHGKSFFQKNVEDLAPEWAETKKIYSESTKEKVEYLVCDTKATLVYLVNLASIELHPWLSRIGSLDKPDFLVLDLDPEDISFNKVVEVALAAKKVLDRLDITAFVKTSGLRGMHIYVSMGARYTYNQVRDFAEILANLIHKETPKISSVERLPEKRRHKVYIDFLQNSEGQTVVAPYSIRPTPDATVSAPIIWDELNNHFDPNNFTIKNIKSRVQNLGDIFKPILHDKNDLKKILAKIKKIN